MNNQRIIYNKNNKFNEKIIFQIFENFIYILIYLYFYAKDALVQLIAILISCNNHDQLKEYILNYIYFPMYYNNLYLFR